MYLSKCRLHRVYVEITVLVVLICFYPYPAQIGFLKESLAEIGTPEGWERGGWRIDIGEYFNHNRTFALALT